MAWHIIHSLLEMVRAHSTFPGKLWIILMFVFRIVVVARIGDNVYHDEQDQFFCNTRTPGCNNVCFNEFSPISQLRFWSLMVLTVSAPGIMFVIYATHKIYHASIKFPTHDDVITQQQHDDVTTQQHKSWHDDTPTTGSYIHPPSVKRKRQNPPSQPLNQGGGGPPSYRLPSSHISAPTICVIKQRRRSTKGEDIRRRNKRRSTQLLPSHQDLLNSNQLLNHQNNEHHYHDWNNEMGKYPIGGYPIYEDIRGSGGRKTEFVKKSTTKEETNLMKNRRMLENPTLFRAYWWHVVLRSLLEGGFLYLQYYLYGMEVAEFYTCSRPPCTQPTDCFISRPTEKTILLRLMFTLGSIASALSLAEFYALGWRRFKDSVCCGGSSLSHDEERILLARLNEHKSSTTAPQRNDVMYVPTSGGMRTDALSLDSASSDTTIESV